MLIIMFLLILTSGCSHKKMDGENNMNNYDNEKSQINTVLGTWESIESDWPMEVNINNIGSKKLTLEILNTKDKEMTTSYNIDDDNWVFYTEDKKIRYELSVYEHEKLLMVKFYNTDDSPNTVRPWILSKKK